MLPCEHGERGVSRADVSAEEARSLAEEIFSEDKPLTYTEMKEAIIKARGCAARTAERNIKKLIAGTVIIHCGGGKYNTKPKFTTT